MRKIFDLFINSVLSSISSKENVEGAPVITLIAFFPEFLSIRIPATPVWRSFFCTIYFVSILFFFKVSNASFP